MTAPRSLDLVSRSRSEDAGYLASRDLADLARELDIEYRLIGGISVGLLTWIHGVARTVSPRETADADFGASVDALADDRLSHALVSRGYVLRGGNRFIRHVADDGTMLHLVVDLLVPSLDGRLRSNVEAGTLSLDAVPGLGLALAMPPTLVDVTVLLSNDERLQMLVVLPDVVAALCLKAEAYKDRLAHKDAFDVWRLLEAASAAGVRAETWSLKGQKLDAARILHRDFGRPGAHGTRAASGDPGTQARIRALVGQVVARA